VIDDHGQSRTVADSHKGLGECGTIACIIESGVDTTIQERKVPGGIDRRSPVDETGFDHVVMNDAGDFIEVQGTAEGHPFNQDELNAMLGLAKQGISELLACQKAALDDKP